MTEDPTGHLPVGGTVLDAVARQVEGEHRRRARMAFPLVSEPPDHDHAVPHEGGGVEVRGREEALRIAVNLDGAVEVEDDDVVVDAEIGIVVVLVFAADADHPPVRVRRARVAPIRSKFQIGPAE